MVAANEFLEAETTTSLRTLRTNTQSASKERNGQTRERRERRETEPTAQQEQQKPQRETKDQQKRNNQGRHSDTSTGRNDIHTSTHPHTQHSYPHEADTINSESKEFLR
mmetsp:Transcript_10490/g.28893  ORF Transcript_10490/g.28893 Transcript_10490/m.28893 type:complete len:109 (-) Transcript_10490:26-352(-)